jgi:alpha-glucosidase
VIAADPNLHWWHWAVIYEITLPSFQDSNGDGFGDLAGVTSRLDYLAELGVDAIWLSPFYQSPFYDLGYDVANHLEIAPRCGSLADFEHLVREAHARRLRVIVDFVPNHTSSVHPWFVESRAERGHRWRDWYLWHDGADGAPPNNWIDRFGESAWTWDEQSQQYYLATFTPQQPDLNWRNPEVRKAHWNVLRYWLGLGVDGVRVDAVTHLIKDAALRNNPVNEGYRLEQEPSNRLTPVFSHNQPQLLDMIGEMKRVVCEYDDRALIAEVYQPPEQIASFQRAGFDILLDTSLLQGTFAPQPLQRYIAIRESLTPRGQAPAHASGNHDIRRLANRIGNHNLRLAAMLQFTLRGATIMYYGEELGLCNACLSPADLQDPSARIDPRYSRDYSRSPMPWNEEPDAGFSTGSPWLPMDEASRQRSVQRQSRDNRSLLNFYRRLLSLRHHDVALRCGEWLPLDATEQMLVYLRAAPGERVGVLLNLSDAPAEWRLPGAGEVLLSTIDEEWPTATADGAVRLRPREGVIVRMNSENGRHA